MKGGVSEKHSGKGKKGREQKKKKIKRNFKAILTLGRRVLSEGHIILSGCELQDPSTWVWEGVSFGTCYTCVSPNGRVYDTPTILQFDPHEELIWIGTNNGWLSSLTIPSLSRYTSFQAHFLHRKTTQPTDTGSLLSPGNPKSPSSIHSLLFSPSGLISASQNNIRFHDRGGFSQDLFSKQVLQFLTKDGPITAVEYIHGLTEHQIAVAGSKEGLYILDLLSGDLVNSLPSNGKVIHKLQRTPHNTLLYAASNCGSVFVYDVRVGALLASVGVDWSSSILSSLTISPDGLTLALCSESSLKKNVVVRLFDCKRATNGIITTSLPLTRVSGANRVAFFPTLSSPNPCLLILSNHLSFDVACLHSYGPKQGMNSVVSVTSLMDNQLPMVAMGISGNGSFLAFVDASGLVQLMGEKNVVETTARGGRSERTLPSASVLTPPPAFYPSSVEGGKTLASVAEVVGYMSLEHGKERRERTEEKRGEKRGERRGEERRGERRDIERRFDGQEALCPFGIPEGIEPLLSDSHYLVEGELEFPWARVVRPPLAIPPEWESVKKNPDEKYVTISLTASEAEKMSRYVYSTTSSPHLLPILRRLYFQSLLQGSTGSGREGGGGREGGRETGREGGKSAIGNVISPTNISRTPTGHSAAINQAISAGKVLEKFLFLPSFVTNPQIVTGDSSGFPPFSPIKMEEKKGEASDMVEGSSFDGTSPLLSAEGVGFVSATEGETSGREVSEIADIAEASGSAGNISIFISPSSPTLPLLSHNKSMGMQGAKTVLTDGESTPSGEQVAFSFFSKKHSNASYEEQLKKYLQDWIPSNLLYDSNGLSISPLLSSPVKSLLTNLEISSLPSSTSPLRSQEHWSDASVSAARPNFMLASTSTSPFKEATSSLGDKPERVERSEKGEMWLLPKSFRRPRATNVRFGPENIDWSAFNETPYTIIEQTNSLYDSINSFLLIVIYGIPSLASFLLSHSCQSSCCSLCEVSFLIHNVEMCNRSSCKPSRIVCAQSLLHYVRRRLMAEKDLYASFLALEKTGSSSVQQYLFLAKFLLRILHQDLLRTEQKREERHESGRGEKGDTEICKLCDGMRVILGNMNEFCEAFEEFKKGGEKVNEKEFFQKAASINFIEALTGVGIQAKKTCRYDHSHTKDVGDQPRLFLSLPSLSPVKIRSLFKGKTLSVRTSVETLSQSMQLLLRDVSDKGEEREEERGEERKERVRHSVTDTGDEAPSRSTHSQGSKSTGEDDQSSLLSSFASSSQSSSRKIVYPAEEIFLKWVDSALVEEAKGSVRGVCGGCSGEMRSHRIHRIVEHLSPNLFLSFPDDLEASLGNQQHPSAAQLSKFLLSAYLPQEFWVREKSRTGEERRDEEKRGEERGEERDEEGRGEDKGDKKSNGEKIESPFELSLSPLSGGTLYKLRSSSFMCSPNYYKLHQALNKLGDTTSNPLISPLSPTGEPETGKKKLNRVLSKEAEDPIEAFSPSNDYQFTTPSQFLHSPSLSKSEGATPDESAFPKPSSPSIISMSSLAQHVSTNNGSISFLGSKNPDDYVLCFLRMETDKTRAREDEAKEEKETKGKTDTLYTSPSAIPSKAARTLSPFLNKSGTQYLSPKREATGGRKERETQEERRRSPSNTDRNELPTTRRNLTDEFNAISLDDTRPLLPSSFPVTPTSSPPIPSPLTSSWILSAGNSFTLSSEAEVRSIGNAWKRPLIALYTAELSSHTCSKSIDATTEERRETALDERRETAPEERSETVPEERRETALEERRETLCELFQGTYRFELHSQSYVFDAKAFESQRNISQSPLALTHVPYENLSDTEMHTLLSKSIENSHQRAKTLLEKFLHQHYTHQILPLLSLYPPPPPKSPSLSPLASPCLPSISPSLLYGIDGEYVATQEEMATITELGVKRIIKPPELQVARVSIVKGCGTHMGTPILDVYVQEEEQVQDYLTRFSGLSQSDLSCEESHKWLITRKELQQKLLFLIRHGGVFIGHGLKKDLRILNCVIPNGQSLDTLDLLHLPGHRYLSLKFLCYYLLGVCIQDESVCENYTGHDSIEDAKAAVYLWYRWRQLEEKGILGDVMKQLYARGYATSFRVPAGEGCLIGPPLSFELKFR